MNTAVFNFDMVLTSLTKKVQYLAEVSMHLNVQLASY